VEERLFYERTFRFIQKKQSIYFHNADFDLDNFGGEAVFDMFCAVFTGFGNVSLVLVCFLTGGMTILTILSVCTLLETNLAGSRLSIMGKRNVMSINNLYNCIKNKLSK